MRVTEFFPLRAVRAADDLCAARGKALAYVLEQPRMMIVLALTLVISTFTFNFNVTLPVLAWRTLHGLSVRTGPRRRCSAQARSSAPSRPSSVDARR